MSERKLSWPAYLAVAGAVVGLASGLFLGGLRLANSEVPQLRAEWLGNLVFTLVYLFPFGLSLMALRWPAVWRAAVWGAAASLAVLGVFTAFSGVTLVLLPAAVLLAPAALAAFAQTSPRRWPVGVLVAVVLAALISGAWLALITGADDGRCWELVQGAAGGSAWQEVPYSQSGTVTAPSTGGEPGVVQVLCTSDIITVAEAGAGLVLLAVAGSLVLWLVRRWPEVEGDRNRATVARHDL